MAIRISPHHHTGRRVHRHHTSYALLVFLSILTGGVILSFQSLIRAEDIGVSAQVLGPPPSTPATITRPVTGDRFTAVPIEVEGTCYNQYFINIYRNGTFAGSTRCRVDDTFLLEIDLIPGSNDLVARIIDFNDQPGPDSDVVTVTYDPPPPPPPEAGPEGPPVAPVPLFLVKPSPTYYVGEVGEEVRVTVELEGGKPPFALSWDWGDGTPPDVVTAPDRSPLSRGHVYEMPGGYTLTITASDSSGQTRFVKISIFIAGEKGEEEEAGGITGLLDPPSFRVVWPLYFLLLLFILSFWLGERYEKHREQTGKS